MLNPDNRKIRWWRQGIARRPHDPDWQPDGTITVYNNNMHREWSTIVSVDPVSYRHEVLLDGADYGFFSHVRGKHQVLDTGGMLVTSTQDGWAFEVDENGEIVFEFLNLMDEEDKMVMSLAEARYLPLDYFQELPTCSE